MSKIVNYLGRWVRDLVSYTVKYAGEAQLYFGSNMMGGLDHPTTFDQYGFMKARKEMREKRLRQSIKDITQSL